MFDLLLAVGKIKLTEGQVILNKDELVGKKYCKCYHSWIHNTIDFIVLRKNIQ